MPLDPPRELARNLCSVVRVVGAGFGAVAACGWIAERALSLQNPVAPVVDFVFNRALYIVALLAIVSTLVAIERRRASPRAVSP